MFSKLKVVAFVATTALLGACTITVVDDPNLDRRPIHDIYRDNNPYDLRHPRARGYIEPRVVVSCNSTRNLYRFLDQVYSHRQGMSPQGRGCSVRTMHQTPRYIPVGNYQNRRGINFQVYEAISNGISYGYFAL